MSQQNLNSQSTESSVVQLCGYLNKLSGKGPLRGFKRKWFVYSPTNCKLYFYRTRDDLLPLGEIDIRRATFSLPWPNKNPSVFNIVSFDKEFILEASDSQSCLYWLKQLQKLRRDYIVELANKFGVKLANYEDDSNLNKSQMTDSTASGSIFYDDNCDVENKLVNPIDAVPKIKHEEIINELTTHPPAKHRIFPNVFKIKKHEHQQQQQQTPSAPSTPQKRKSDKFENKCLKCKEAEEQIVSLSDDLSAIENELQASREVIKLLQQQLEIMNHEKQLLHDICKKGTNIPSQDYVDHLTKLNEEVSKLKVELRHSEYDKESLQNELQKVKNENHKYIEEISAMKELIESRDKTVVTLTNEIFDLETENRIHKRSISSMNQVISSNQVTSSNQANDFKTNSNQDKQQTKELEDLRDRVKAYEQQNEFLNREIIELNEIRNVIEMKEHQSQTKITDLEAKCSQIQSKLLALLKEIKQSISETKDSKANNESIITNDTVLTLVNRLLEENSLDIPLSWRQGNRRSTSSNDSSTLKNCDCDDMGFYIKSNNQSTDFNDMISSPSISVSASSMSYEPYTNTNKNINTINDEISDNKSNSIWRSKWDAFVGNLNNHELTKSQELKSMLRTGIPQEYRGKVWKAMIYARLKGKCNELGADYYQHLLKQSPQTGNQYDPSAKQIELDLLRTLPNNKHFESLESDGTQRLRRVLTAFSRHNPVVGYCQGLNRLASVSLLFMPEENAFWCLVAIVETIMPPDYYGRNLLGAHVDQYVLRHLLAEKLPRLNSHFEQHGIELSLFSWFLTAFVDNIPVRVYLRIWDVFLYEGNKVLFRFALAFLKMHEEQILQMKDSVSINQFLRTLGERPCDVKQLCYIAFVELNPFPYRTLKTKRIYHTKIVKEELEKLEELRRTLPNHDRSFDSQSD